METKFEKGKWYKDISSPTLYIKYNKAIKNNWFESDEKIYDKIHKFLPNDNWRIKERNWVETDLSEIQQYLPEGHPDKQSIEKWSVGSYVVFLDDNIGNNGFNKGEYQEIIKLDYSRFTKGAISYKEGTENDLKWEEAGKIRWFATKSEAEEFAKSLVEVKETKPKQLTIDDLVEGEIYKVTTEKFNIIHKFSKYNSSNNYATFKCFLRIEDKYYSSQANGLPNYPNYVWNNTTPQEKKHLNVCIQQDKFIPQDQLDLYDDVTFELKTVMKQTKFKIGDKVKILFQPIFLHNRNIQHNQKNLLLVLDECTLYIH